MSRRAWRLPMLVLLPALVVAGVVVERGRTDDGTGTEVATSAGLGPEAPGEGALGATWYCPAGSATGVASGEGAGPAEHVVLVANLSDQPASVDLTVFPEGGEPTTEVVEVPAATRTDVRVSEIATAPWASVVVEATGGRVAVEHELSGPQGRTVSPCASRPSTTWYLPASTSRAGTNSYVVLFNPFPDEASVDLSFETEDGTRTPGEFQGLVVPGSRTLVVDVGQVVTLRERLATTVQARNGRVVAEQLLVADGTDDRPAGVTAAVGAPAAATSWVLPDLAAPEAPTVATTDDDDTTDDDTTEETDDTAAAPPEPSPVVESQVAVLNPGDDDAEVEVQVFLDDPEVNGSAEPFTLTVPGGRSAVVDLLDGRIPVGVGSWALVRSTNGVPVVAEHLAGGREAAASPGLTATLGSPVAADDWVVPGAVLGTPATSTVTIVNPRAVGDVTARVVARAAGATSDLPGATEVVVPAGERVVLDLGVEGRSQPGLVLEVEADGPVVVGRGLGFDGDVASPLALPVQGTVVVLDLDDLARPEALSAAPTLSPEDDVVPGGDPNVTVEPPEGGAGADTDATTTTTSTTSADGGG